MTIKEQETIHSVHLRQDNKITCGHRYTDHSTKALRYVTCPECLRLVGEKLK